MQTVIGAFEDRQQAEQAVQRLVQMGIDRQDVHVEQKDQPAGTPQTKTSKTDISAGGGGEEHRGFFARLFGMDDDDADGGYREHVDTFGEAVHRGTSIVVVDAVDDQQAEKAATCLHEAGAIDIDERATQWRQDGWTGGGQVRAPQQQASLQQGARPQQQQGDVREGQKLDVVQEELQVGKRAIEKGGVRVFQRITEKPVREVVRLREERAFVDRQPVNRELRGGEMEAFKEGSVEVREMAEEPVVAKTARVVEEVRVGKQVQEREATVEDKVRRKDVEVERLGGSRAERAVASDRDEAIRSDRDPDTGLPRNKP
jgi:stress response protein YsnF